MRDQRTFDRLIAKTKLDPVTGCWLWTGFYHKTRKYAAHRYGGTSIPAPGTKRGSRTLHTHRAMWIVVHGEPAKGLCVCHKCDVPLCINPDHLFLGTHKENMADSKKKGRHFLSAKTICKRGHYLGGPNLYICSSGLRHCKECERERHRKQYHENPQRHNQRQRIYRQRKKDRLSAPSSPTVSGEPRG